MFKRLKLLLTKKDSMDYLLPKSNFVSRAQEPSDDMPDDFCLCCSPGIRCPNKSNIKIEEHSDNDSVISIK